MRNHKHNSIEGRLSNETGMASSATPSVHPLRDNGPSSIAQRKQVEAMAGGGPAQPKASNTGLPEQLKSGIRTVDGGFTGVITRIRHWV